MRRIIMTLALLAFSTTSFAAPETLSLKQALALGLQHNFDLQVSQLDVERADAGIMGEEGRFDVLAELVLGVSRNELPLDSAIIADDLVTTDQGSAEAALSKTFVSGLETRLSLVGESNDTDALADQLDPAYRTYLTLDLTQPLLKDMGIDINTTDLRIAKTRQQQAALEYLSQAQQLATEIELAYLDLVQADEEYRYAVLARDLAQELLDGNQRKFEAGLVPITEVSEASAAMVGRAENILLSEQRRTLAQNQLLELIEQGDAELPQSWQVSLPAGAEGKQPSLENALAIGFEKRPDLQQARLEIDSRKIALVYADNQLLPRLDLEASLGVNGLSGNGDDAHYDGQWHRSVERAFAQDGNSWYAGLRFSVPLQNRSAKARYRDAAAQDKQSLYRLRRTEVSAETLIRSAHAVLGLGEERMQVAGRYAELAETTLNQETRRLQEGLSNSFRVLTFQNALVDAKIREISAKTDYRRAQANLYQAMGTNLERYNIIAALPHEGVTP